MIYTLTISPAIDYHMYIDQVILDDINKSKTEECYAGGKGINVSFMLKTLGYESICLGFVGGNNGQFIANELDKAHIKHDFVWTDVNTRINVKISANSGETAIDGTGNPVKRIYVDQLLEKTKTLKKGDMLVISGNTCNGVDHHIYEEILDNLDKNVIVIVDTVRDLLLSTLKYRPYFVKPNLHELREVLNLPINNDQELIDGAKKLQEMGARNVIVTLGGKGAFVLTENQTQAFIEVPQSISSTEVVINTVGCGDATIAGTIYKFVETGDFLEATKYGVSAGIASAYKTRFASVNEIERVYREIKELYRKKLFNQLESMNHNNR